MLISRPAILFDRSQNDLFELARNPRVHRGGRRGPQVQDLAADDAGSLTVESYLSCRHFVENRTEREKIGTCVQILPADLLRGHISRRANNRSGHRQVDGCTSGGDRGTLGIYRLHQLGQTEIEYFGLPLLVMKMLAGFRSR